MRSETVGTKKDTARRTKNDDDGGDTKDSNTARGS